MSGLTFEVFTLFPEAIAEFLRAGLVGKAVEQGKVAVHCTNFRDFTHDRHRTVDDAPYGGGPGMVMKIEPVVAALEHVTRERGPMHRVLLTPSGARFDQRVAERLAALPRIGLLCGRYEGIDDRVREHFIDECLSLGDFVLNGGEVAALAVVEAVARLREGVLGNPDSAARDSFSLEDMSQEPGDSRRPAGPWLEFPQYTRPPEFRGLAVPRPLLAGAHAEVARWRLWQAWRRTWALRPDLRPRLTRPPGAPAVLAVLVGRGTPDHVRRDLFQALAPAAAAHGARLVAVHPGLTGPSSFRGLKELRKSLRREHGRTPRVVVLGDADLPLAHSRPALLDLLAATGEGDLSAPLILLLIVDAEGTGDLTQFAGEAPQSPPPWLLEALGGAEAAFALPPGDPAAVASGLAQTPAMNDSSGPQPVHRAVSIAISVLAELLPARSTLPSELRHEQQQPVD